jgi:hypothetical protein
LRATSGRSCSLPNRLFFETQPFLANESPNRTPIVYNVIRANNLTAAETLRARLT